MYRYELCSLIGSAVLFHEKSFTQDEFNQMCKAAPTRYIEKYDVFVYDKDSIIGFLLENYGFQNLRTQASFDVDTIIENEAE